MTLLVSVTISLVGKSDAESAGCSAAIGGVTSVIECPDPIPAIGFVELSHLLTTVFGTFETCRPALKKSGYWGRPEVVGEVPK